MSEIADLTFNVVAFAEVMGMVWKRLNDSGKNWRHVYKVPLEHKEHNIQLINIIIHFFCAFRTITHWHKHSHFLSEMEQKEEQPLFYLPLYLKKYNHSRLEKSTYIYTMFKMFIMTIMIIN